MKLAKVIHLDDSDQNVFHSPARTGEWAISGGFEYSNFTEADLVGKARQAFAHGWRGLETFGRATLVAATTIEEHERETLITQLAQHFVDMYGAPSVEVAMPVAKEEVMHMLDLCDEHDPGTVLTVSRELTQVGVNESFRTIERQDAALDIFAVHGSLGPDG